MNATGTAMQAFLRKPANIDSLLEDVALGEHSGTFAAVLNTPVLSGVIPGFAAVVPQNGSSPMPASWNQVAAWLKQIEGLRRVA
jgi:hypothetical protein